MASQEEIRSGGHGKPKGTKSISHSKKAGLEFSVSEIAQHLKDGKYADHINNNASVYLTAVLEYLTVEVLESAGDAAKDFKSKQILPRHILLAIRHDNELNKLLKSVTIAEGGVLPNIHPSLFPKKKMKPKDDEQGQNQGGGKGEDEDEGEGKGLMLLGAIDAALQHS